MPFRRGPLPLWAHAADAGALALVFLGIYVVIDGGFVLWPNSLRLSVKSEWRVFAWVVALVAVRHLFIRDRPLHRRLITGFRDIARAPGPLLDDPGAARLPSAEQGHRSSAGYAAGIIALFVVLTAVMTYPQVRHLSNGVSIDEGDALFSVWRLAWVAHQLPRDPVRLFDANIFHPELRTLAFSDAMIAPALMSAPLLWLGVHQLTVYNLTFLSGFALSGAAMFLLVRSLTGHTRAALLSGFIFAFLPYRFMHYAHLELQMAYWMPLCLWALHRTVKHGNVRDGLLTGLFFALQCLSSWYYGIFLFTVLIPIGVALLLGQGGQPLLKPIRAVAAGGLLAALFVVPMAMPYIAARQSVGERPVDEIEFYSATAQNYMAAHPRNALFGRMTSKWGGQERELFMGIIVPLIAMIGLWPPLSAARIAYAMGLVVAFDVSLGYNGLLYPWFHAYLFPYRGLRVPARMAMLVGLSLAILAGYGAARLMRLAKTQRASLAVFLGLAVLIFFEYRTTPLELRGIPSRPPPIYDVLPAGQANVLLELPLIRPDISLEPTYMYFSTFRWYRLANGYSGFKPPSYDVLVDQMKRFPDEASIEEVRRRGVTHVVVHEAYFRRGEHADYTTLVSRLKRCADLEPVTTVRWQNRDSRLYRLRPAAQTDFPNRR
jgi:hypothetical protein